jgi:hypothetical protein
MSCRLVIFLSATGLVAASSNQYTRCISSSECTSAPFTVCGAVPVGGGRQYCVMNLTVSKATSPRKCPVPYPEGNECCKDADCSNSTRVGACDSWPGVPYCGGPVPMPKNKCIYPECTSTTNCGTGSVCVQAGAFTQHSARCIVGECSEDSNCQARAGGRCLPFFQPVSYCGSFYGFFCTYTGDDCGDNTDCDKDKVCSYDKAAGKTSCVTPTPPPP